MLAPNLYFYTGILNTVTSFGLGVFVYRKNPTSLVHRLWCAMSVCVAMWAALFAVEILMDDPRVDLPISRIEQASAVCIPVFYMHFVMALLDVHRRALNRFILTIVYFLTSFSVLIAPTTLFVQTVVPQPIFDHRLYEVAGPFYAVFLILYGACVSYSLALLVGKVMSATQQPQRGQYRGVLGAGLVGFSMGALCFPLVYNIQVEPLGFHFVWLYCLFTAYAIFKHHLMDIRIAIRKSVVYSLLVTVMTLAYFTAAFVGERYFQSALGYRSLALSVVLFAGTALAFQPLKQRLQRWVDQWLLPEPKEALARRLELLEQEVRETDKAKAVSRLAAGIAHEIKNPLTVLRTFVAFLLERRTDPQFIEQFQQVANRELEHLQQIARGLLDFAKPHPPQREPLNLRAVLDQVVALTRPDLLDKGIAVDLQYGHNGAALMGDPGQLSQAFLNLVLNARDAMARGGALTISTRTIGGTIEVVISDTGQGIAVHDLPRLFEPFFTRKPHGTGLGLSIVQQILHDHGGTIVVASHPGRGTTFTIRLPLQPVSPCP